MKEQFFKEGSDALDRAAITLDFMSEVFLIIWYDPLPSLAQSMTSY